MLCNKHYCGALTGKINPFIQVTTSAMIRPQILTGVDLMSAQSREHPPGWVKHTPKHLGSLMFVFWLKLHVPFGCGLSQNAPASIKFTGERAAQLCLCPASTYTTPSPCGKHSPPSQTGKPRHTDITPLLISHSSSLEGSVLSHTSLVPHPGSHSSTHSRVSSAGSTQN